MPGKKKYLVRQKQAYIALIEDISSY